jgi:hypothetical protein
MKLSKRGLALSLVLVLVFSVFYACGETTTTETGEVREGTQPDERAGAPTTTPETGQPYGDPGATGGMDGTTTSPEGETAQRPGTDTGTTTQ